MPKPILVANWKNYPGSLGEAKEILKGLAKKKLIYKKVHVFVAPPLPYFESVSARINGFAELASQDFFPQEKVTVTGAVTPEILKSFGVRLAILGHSERRAQGETAAQVAEKVKAALKAGLTPVVCFGEKERDEGGEHFQFLQEELKTLLSGVGKKDLEKIVLAYEPLWAIGKKSVGPIDPVELSQTVVFIRKVLSDLFGRKVAEAMPILYGGSVDHTNAGLLVRNSGIRGFLVGRASLNPQSFEGIALSMVTK
jgi:triosephosphate isomerase